ncbi:phage tail spike protein [Lactobacillus delbrueckii]|uniref:phage tail spike protein n=1 Tax=Lactobacillus delbrueckii TaxID=1584 RepID=UPI0025B23AAF|nr:phage tail spike protein [Lactobacillus delbrueckii]
MASKQYLILNNSLKRIGTLSVDGATVFTSDTITHQYASSDQTNSSYGDNPDAEDTTQSRSQNRKSKEYNHYGTIVVPQGQPDSPKVSEGNYIAKHDEVLGRWYIFRIWHTSETLLASGQAATSAEIIDLGLWELAHNIVPAKTFSNVSAKVAFEWLTQKLTWALDTSKLDTTLTLSELQFDGTSRASSMLQTLLQDYDLECYFYCKATSNGTITDKIFEVGNKLNSEIYSGTVFVGENVTGCTREITGNVVTKLYVFGPNGETMANANGGKTYIVDEAANRQYNPNWRSTYLEGAYTTSTTADAQGLKAIAKTILADTNHPQYAYTVTVPHDMHPILGSTIRTINTDFVPEMATKERVMATTESIADPSQNSVSFGEFQTVTRITPSWLSNFTSEIASAVQKAMQDSSSIEPVVLTPDGLDFDSTGSSKRAIIQAYEGGTNISAYLDSNGFIFRQLQSDGQYGATSTGYLQSVTGLKLGEYRATIDNDYFSTTPEVAADQTNAKSLGRLSPTARGMDATEQYVVKLSDGSYLSSTASPVKSLDGHGNDTLYQHWSSDGKLIDDMMVASGGHGSSFGIKEESGTIWIYGITKNFSSSDERFRISKFKYQGGKDITETVTSNTDSFIIGCGFGSDDPVRVSYDVKNNLLGVVIGDGHFEVLNPAQALAGDHDVLYRIDLTQYGFNLNTQTFQSACLDFPYVYWHSGDYDMHDYRMLYCANVVHGGKEFELNYDFSQSMPLKYDRVEPETIWMQPNGKLLASFNCHDPQDGENTAHTHAMFEIPVITRPAMSLPKGAIPE